MIYIYDISPPASGVMVFTMSLASQRNSADHKAGFSGGSLLTSKEIDLRSFLNTELLHFQSQLFSVC